MLSLSILWLSCCGRVAFCISQKMKAGILLQRQFCDVSSPSPPPHFPPTKETKEQTKRKWRRRKTAILLPGRSERQRIWKWGNLSRGPEQKKKKKEKNNKREDNKKLDGSLSESYFQPGATFIFLFFIKEPYTYHCLTIFHAKKCFIKSNTTAMGVQNLQMLFLMFCVVWISTEHWE
jgi:hypothetical protein